MVFERVPCIYLKAGFGIIDDPTLIECGISHACVLYYVDWVSRMMHTRALYLEEKCQLY